MICVPFSWPGAVVAIGTTRQGRSTLPRCSMHGRCAVPPAREVLMKKVLDKLREPEASDFIFERIRQSKVHHFQDVTAAQAFEHANESCTRPHTRGGKARRKAGDKRARGRFL